MKILILYFSQTGNTKKIAKAMYDTLKDQKTDLREVNEISPQNLDDYDLIFLGSGIYASRVSNEIVKLIKKASSFPENFAFFCTHASLDLYQKPFKKIEKILNKSNIKILGHFDCVGENLGIPEEKQKKMLENLPEEEKKKALKTKKIIKGRPNQKDLKHAQEFAQKIIDKIL